MGDLISKFKKSPTMEKSSSTHKIIACVGPTGCGKSRIIDCLAKTKWAATSLAFEAQPQAVRSAEIQLEGSTVVLIDTPGFDDYTVLPSQTVHKLRSWLQSKYNQSMCLTGIIYLHQISDKRITKKLPLDLEIFLRQDGGQVLLVTTMWDITPHTVAEGRETQLRTEYWKDMLDIGAGIHRFDNKEETARQIVRRLLAGN